MKNINLIKKALLIRKFEEKLLQLFSQGELFGTIHTCIGEEWIAVVAANSTKREILFSLIIVDMAILLLKLEIF